MFSVNVSVLTFFMCSKLMHNFVPMKTKFDEVAAFLCHGNHKMFLKDVKKCLKDLNHTLGRGGESLVGKRRDEVKGGELKGRRGKDGELTLHDHLYPCFYK